MRKALRGWLGYALSLALAAGILAWLLGRQKWSDLSATAAGAHPGYLLAAAGVAVAYWLVRIARWKWVAGLEGQRLSWRTSTISMLAGLGVGLVTPLRGGEVVRPLFVLPGSRLRLVGWIIVERFFDLSAVLVLCMLGLIYLGSEVNFLLPTWLGWLRPSLSLFLWVTTAVLLTVTLGVLLLVHYRPPRLWAAVHRLLPQKAQNLASADLSWGRFAAFFATSFLAELLSISGVFLCLCAFRPSVELMPSLARTPVVMLNNLLPITPGGAGVREAAAVTVFGAVVDQQVVLACYLSNFLIFLLLPGAIGVLAGWGSVMTSLKKRAGAADTSEGGLPFGVVGARADDAKRASLAQRTVARDDSDGGS